MGIPEIVALVVWTIAGLAAGFFTGWNMAADKDQNQADDLAAEVRDEMAVGAAASRNTIGELNAQLTDYDQRHEKCLALNVHLAKTLGDITDVIATSNRVGYEHVARPNANAI
ncbi:hypothetical protein DRH27_02090, partial [Candidatus Falkowbacteria bacterium]